MKCNTQQTEIQRNWNSVYENLVDNLALVLLVLHDEYGFGRDRIGKILASMTETAKRFDEYQADDVLDVKREQLTDGFLDVKDLHEFLKIRLKGVIPEWCYNNIFYSTTPALREARAKYRRNTQNQHKSDISLSEAAEIQRKMLAVGQAVQKMSDKI